MVLAALGEAVWSELVVVDLVECKIDGTVICALDDGMVVCAHNDALFLFCFLILEVDFVSMLGTGEVSVVAGDMI
jgi:hypothetical protein